MTGEAPRPEPTDEELRAALEEQMRRITVDDVLVQTAVTLVTLGGRRLGLPGPEGQPPDAKDLGQAQKAIEATRALVPFLPDDARSPVRDALSQLQMAFAREAQGPGEPPPGAPEPEPKPADERSDDAERAKARSKIWTPPGT